MMIKKLFLAATLFTISCYAGDKDTVGYCVINSPDGEAEGEDGQMYVTFPTIPLSTEETTVAFTTATAEKQENMTSHHDTKAKAGIVVASKSAEPLTSMTTKDDDRKKPNLNIRTETPARRREPAKANLTPTNSFRPGINDLISTSTPHSYSTNLQNAQYVAVVEQFCKDAYETK